jgi:hypothetical protein
MLPFPMAGDSDLFRRQSLRKPSETIDPRNAFSQPQSQETLVQKEQPTDNTQEQKQEQKQEQPAGNTQEEKEKDSLCQAFLRPI